MSRFTGFLGVHNSYGRWVPAKDITAKAIAGAATVDFSDAIFTEPVVTVYAKAFWGGVQVIVPPGVAVEQNGNAILGAFGGNGGVYAGQGGSFSSKSGEKVVVTVKVVGTALLGAVSAGINERAQPVRLVSKDEAERILREEPAPASTTKQDMKARGMEKAAEVLAAKGIAMPGAGPPGGMPPAAAAARAAAAGNFPAAAK